MHRNGNDLRYGSLSSATCYDTVGTSRERDNKVKAQVMIYRRIALKVLVVVSSDMDGKRVNEEVRDDICRCPLRAC